MHLLFCVWYIVLSLNTHLTEISAFAVTRTHYVSCMKNNYNSHQKGLSTTRLNGITEWRDMSFDKFSIIDLNEDIDEELINDGPLREICALPFPYEEVILPGETRELAIHDEQFINLFYDCMENHSGVVAMGLLARSGVIQSVPLCEIEAYNRIEGFGIFVTLRVVGRASLLTLTQQEPYMKAICCEKVDKISQNIDLINLLASEIERFIGTINSMEIELQKADDKKDDCSNLAATTLDDNKFSSSSDADMTRRIFIAKLEDIFNDNADDRCHLNDKDEDCDEVEDDFENDLDRSGRFRSAFNTAKAYDHQGYIKPLTASKCEKSLQDLNAISWAAFCTENDSQEIASYRIKALDCHDLFERMKLGGHMLKEKKEYLLQLMKKNGI